MRSPTPPLTLGDLGLTCAQLQLLVGPHHWTRFFTFDVDPDMSDPLPAALVRVMLMALANREVGFASEAARRETEQKVVAAFASMSERRQTVRKKIVGKCSSTALIRKSDK